MSFLFKNKMNDHKNLLQGGMQEENRAKKPISASPTRSQLVIANSNADLTGPSEVVFNVCCLCVYCPLCILWCCIKLPCAIGWRAIQKAGRHLGGCSGCGRSLSMKIKATDYSSFSDIDSDEVKYKAHSLLKRIGWIKKFKHFHQLPNFLSCLFLWSATWLS